jgi:hypothetical protein
MIDNQKNLQAVESNVSQPLVVPEAKTDSGITGAMGALPTSNIVEQEASVTVPSTQGPRIQDTQGARRTEGPLGLNNYYAETAPLTSSWENKAEQQSDIKFQQDVLAGKQTMLRSAQEAQAQGQEMQTQLALGQYMRAQSTEKAGWTGGYMLDQKRQGDYLKASIQAQMYGQQELQRYGMETQLEAARLAYDLGKEQLAYQLYQQEYQKSITEAQMFGYYVSPENRDLLNQLRASQAVLSDVNATEEEKARATVVRTQIDTWFGEQNLDPNDISKFAEITMEREQWNQAKLDAVLATINDDPSTFIARKSDGTYETDPATGQYVKLNFDDINSADLATFLSKDDGSDNKFADATFRSYAKFLAQSSINDYFVSLGEDGVPTVEGLNTYLAGAGADKLQAFRDKNPGLKETIDAILADNFSPSLSRNGVTITYGRDGTTSPTNPTQPTGNSNTPVSEGGLTPTQIIQTYEIPTFEPLVINSNTNWINNNSLFDGASYIKKETKFLFDTGFFKDGDVVKIPKYDGSIAQTGEILGHTYGVLKDGKIHQIDINRIPGENKDAFFGNKLKDLSNIVQNQKNLLDYESSLSSTKTMPRSTVSSSYIFNFLNNSNIRDSNRQQYMNGVSQIVNAAINGTLKDGAYITLGNSSKALYYKNGKFHEINNIVLNKPAGTAAQQEQTRNKYISSGIFANWGSDVSNLMN